MKISNIYLHELDQAKCDLHCRGCYTKKNKQSSSKLLSDINISSNPKIHHILYVNNKKTPLHITDFAGRNKDIELKIYFGGSIATKTVIIDSLYYSTVDSITNKYISSNFNTIIISTRTFNSVVKSIKLSNMKIHILFTVGIDNFDILLRIMNNDNLLKMIDTIEINIVKPANFEIYTKYLKALELVSSFPNVVYDDCMAYIAQERNCSLPMDGVMDITCVSKENNYYFCAYPENKCIATI